MSTLTIPEDIITPLIEARVNEAVLNALGDKSAVLTMAIAGVLNTKVDSNGKFSSYTNRNSKTWLSWAVSDRVQKAVLAAMTEALDKHEKEIKRMIIAELKKRNSPMIRQLVAGMVGSLGSLPKYRISVSIDDSR